MKVFQIRQDNRFAWYETSKEHMEDMVNKCNWQGRVLELAKDDSAHQVQPLPKWIDDQKGSGPDTDALIEYIEQLRAAQPVQQPAPVSDAALLSAIRDGVPLEEPVSVAKAMMAQVKASACLDKGIGPLAMVQLVNIQVQPWTHTKETATAYADGFNRGVEWLRSSIIEYAEKLPPANVAPVGEDQIITERDAFHDVADNLANAIAAYFGVEIGEHSSANCPWDEALRVIEEAGQVDINAAAKVIYYLLPAKGDGDPHKYPWVHGGNSDMQELARDMARAILAAAKKGPTT